MTEHRRNTPAEIDDTNDRMGAVHPLDFDQDNDQRRGRVGDEQSAREYEDGFPPERVQEAGMTGGEMPDGHVTQDDLAPETLIPEDGARAPDERGHGLPADQDLSEVDERDVAMGGGLDEAEEGRYRPLYGQPWDGPADDDEDTGLSDDDATLTDDDALAENEDVLSDEELEGEAPLDSQRDKPPRR